MATQPKPVLDTRPLGSVPVDQLLALLASEREAWRDVLRWEVGEVGRAVEQAARFGLLHGTALTVDGRARGYVSHHATRKVFRLSGMHLERGAPLAGAQYLAEAALSHPDAQGRQLEGQLVAFDAQPALDRAFADRGVRVVPRSYRIRPLGPADARQRAAAAVKKLDWSHLEDCARVLVTGHRGQLEAEINASFRDEAGAVAYLQEIRGGAGCGSVVAEACSAAWDSGRLIGFCTVTAIAPAVGHVPQVVVLPEAQAGGVGTALLRRSLAVLAAGGHRFVTLGVSRGNERAASWYDRLGFEEATRFAAYCRDPD